MNEISAKSFQGWKLNLHHLNLNERHELMRMVQHGTLVIHSVADLANLANSLSRMVEKWPYPLNPSLAINYLLLSDKQLEKLCCAVGCSIEQNSAGQQGIPGQNHLKLHGDWKI